ncbi:hypothetical protein F8388_011432 [Cannabis sativa]|uniref:Uncharacterized protein n=1 Tax=Cannabis sativa TaxID=3483 RepID=A0A7J6EW75_CANSA|nr:hypothetical protein F8388_011432 [Cannabis sativa]
MAEVQKQALQCRNGNQAFEIGTVQEQNQRGYMYENATNNTDKIDSLEWIGCLFTSKSITLCCQFSSNGKYLASADAKSAANHIRFQPNNGKLAFASGNGVGFFNTQTRNVVFTKKVHKETVHLVCWDYYGEHIEFKFGHYLKENSLKLWNDIGRMRTSFGAHGGNVRALAESKETNMIASAGDDHCVNLWKGKSTNARKAIKADSHTKNVDNN